MTDPNSNNPAKQKLEHLDEWLRRVQVAKRMEPEIVKARGTTAWEVDALDTLEKESPDMAREVKAGLGPSVQTVKAMLPLPPLYDMRAAGSTAVANVSSANSVFEAVIAVSAQEPQQQASFVTLIERYRRLQEEQEREVESADKVGQLFADLIQRFEEARRAAHVALGSGIPHDKEAATRAMRAFLYKLYGEFEQMARQHPSEQKVSWELIAERLCTGLNVSIVLEQERSRDSLMSSLSAIDKGRWSAYDFRDLWTRFIDHVYVVCGAVLASRPR